VCKDFRINVNLDKCIIRKSHLKTADVEMKKLENFKCLGRRNCRIKNAGKFYQLMRNIFWKWEMPKIEKKNMSTWKLLHAHTNV
jgi:hypothetical protein